MAGMIGSQFSAEQRGPGYAEYSAWASSVQGNPFYSGKNQSDFFYYSMMGYNDPVDWTVVNNVALTFNESSLSYDNLTLSGSGGLSYGHSIFNQAKFEYQAMEKVLILGTGFGMAGQNKLFSLYGKIIASYLRNSVNYAPGIKNPFFRAEALMVDAGFLIAGSEIDEGIVFMLYGLDKGKVKTYSEVGGGFGVDGGIGVDVARIDYFGKDIGDFGFESLVGKRIRIYGGYIVGGGLSWGQSPTGGYIVGTSVSVGFYASILGPLFGGGNYGEVFIPGY